MNVCIYRNPLNASLWTVPRMLLMLNYVCRKNFRMFFMSNGKIVMNGPNNQIHAKRGKKWSQAEIIQDNILFDDIICRGRTNSIAVVFFPYHVAVCVLFISRPWKPPIQMIQFQSLTPPFHHGKYTSNRPAQSQQCVIFQRI